MKSKKYLWLISLLSIGTIATTITAFSCSNNASSEEESKPPVIDEEKDNWNSYPSNESIKITNIKSKVSNSTLHIEINGQNLSTNINDYKIIINETGEDIINYTNVTGLKFSPYVKPPTKDNVVLNLTFNYDNNMIAILNKLSCKKFIILIDNKAPILESSAISSNIFPGPISINSINLKIEYDENNQPISLIYEVKGKNLFMDYNVSDIDNSNNWNNKIMIQLIDEQYNLRFEYEFLSDLSNTNEFNVKLTLSSNDFKKISGKKYNFLIMNKWKFFGSWGNLYFPNFY